MLSNPWVLVVLAGHLEIGWALGWKYPDGFTKPIASVITVVGALASFWLLSAAMKGLPVGTADAVWAGIGTVGTAVAAMILLGEPVNALRVAGIALIVAGIAVLKLV